MTNPQLPPVFDRALNDFEAVLGASARPISAPEQVPQETKAIIGAVPLSVAPLARDAEPDVVKKEEEKS